ERLLYLPSVGLCLALPALFVESGRGARPAWRRTAGVALAALVAILGVRTAVRNRDWSDQLTLFDRTVAASPRSAIARFHLGQARGARGRRDEAIAQYRRAVEIREDLAEARHNLGRELLEAGEVREAIEQIGAAAALDPSLPDVGTDLGVALARAG